MANIDTPALPVRFRFAGADSTAGADDLARDAGVFVEPACAAAHVGLVKARAANVITAGDEVVLQLTGSGFKDIKSAIRAVPAPRTISSINEVSS